MPTLPTKLILESQDVQTLESDPAVLSYIHREQAQATESVPFAQDDVKIYILTTNKHTAALQSLKDDLQEKYNKKSILYYTSDEGIRVALQWYEQQAQQAQKTQQAQTKQRKALGSRALDMIQEVYQRKDQYVTGDFVIELVRLAYQSGASDCHFQPEKTGVYMKVRLDGVLHNLLHFSHEEFYPYCKKLKFIAGTKMNVEYIPQDGRFSFEARNKRDSEEIGNVNIDVRVSIMPGIESESIVLRYLDSGSSLVPIDQMGFGGQALVNFKKGIDTNFGLILLTGPTGSGKTTTLYSLLAEKNDGKRKIITLENPIEYHMDGIQQSQINYSKGYGFIAGLKACLRHDPDIILVGETRTKETAETVVNAALTGHLVFTTLHTNSALEAVQRLMSMGVESYMVGPSLRLIVAQRLVRKVCSHCGVQRDVTPSEQEVIQQTLSSINGVTGQRHDFAGKVMEARGCDYCNQTGYKGRIAIVEVLLFDETLQELVTSTTSEKELLQHARRNGFLTLQEDAIVKVLEGVTTMEEVRRVL